jgi:hypothetical protein
MSDPTPEDLYEALRKRLADYGQEPPPGLWAGIRQQLPPPVAVPRRRRWRTSLALLSLLFVVASLTTWQWHRTGSQVGQSGTVARRAGALENFDNKQTARTANSLPAEPGLGAAASPKSGGSASALSDAALHTTVQQATVAPEQRTDGLAATAPLAKNPNADALKAGAAAKSVTPEVAMATQATGRSTRRKRALALGSRESANSAARHRLRSARATGLGRTTTDPARPDKGLALHSTRTSPPTAATQRLQPVPGAAFSATKVAEETSVAAPASVAAASSSRAGADTPDRPATLPPAGPPEPGLAVAAPDATQPGAAQPGAWDWLALRVPGLQLPAGATLPAPQPVEATPLPPVVPTVLARWAVQLVAGPGLTYRHLGSSPLSYTTTSVATPTTSSPIFSGANPNRIQTISPRSVAELERPALGYSAQLSIRHALTPHWTVSGGLGYAEYATSLALRQVSAAQITRTTYDFAFLDSLSRSSGTTIRQRDTYRFLTVPLRAGYVWNPGRRWQVGLLGGVEAAIYLGGTTTEGSDCACQPRTWGASGSPYRPLSLGASLGAEVRYRLAGPWQLLAQPTASYLLTPLAKPVSGYSIRHPFGATAMLGVSYELP